MKYYILMVTSFLLHGCEEYKSGSGDSELAGKHDPEGLAGDSDRPFSPTIEDFNFQATEINLDVTDIREFESQLSVAVAEYIVHVTHSDLIFPCTTEFVNELAYEDDTIKINYVEEEVDLESVSCILLYTFEYRIDMSNAPLDRYVLVAGADEAQVNIIE
jgi:hypothetical protein